MQRVENSPRSPAPAADTVAADLSCGSVNPPHLRELEPSTQSFLVLFNDIIPLNWLCQVFLLPFASCTRLPLPGDGRWVLTSLAVSALLRVWHI